MQKIVSKWMMNVCAAAVLLALSACGPQYETTYHYTPPNNQQGMMCLNGCLAEKNNCERDCQWQQRDCEDKAERQADRDYKDYVDERRAEGREIKRDRDSFVRSCYGMERCMEDCMPAHNLCYSNCGGRVMENTVCVANCDQQ